MMRARLLTVAALAAVLAAPAALAQQPQTQRLGGTIERLDGNTIYGKAADGSAIILKLSGNAAITAVSKATFADIKPGDYVGTGAVPQPDGTQKAVELRIFPKPQEDGGHFNEGWYGAPNGTMTNGFAQPVTGTTAGTGAGEPAFRAQAATKQPDGSYTASAIAVGKDGARPF
jgi:hypothetical protein